MPSEVKRRVARGDSQELRDLAMRSGINIRVLREAVYAVGTDPAKVQIYLAVRNTLKRHPRAAPGVEARR